jgi:hypothetical protein
MKVKLKYLNDEVEMPVGYILVTQGKMQKRDKYWDIYKKAFINVKDTGWFVSSYYCVIRRKKIHNHPQTKIFI